MSDKWREFGGDCERALDNPWKVKVVVSHSFFDSTIFSATLLWHSMLGISVIMYTGTYVSRVRPEVNHGREIKAKALEEYYAHHGGAHH